MQYNLTKEFLTELNEHLSHIDKLEYLKINIPVYDNNQIKSLNKYFKDVATFDTNSGSDVEYVFGRIKLSVFHAEQHFVNEDIIRYYAKFKGSPEYRLLENTSRNFNISVGDVRLPFSRMGIVSAKVLLDERYLDDALATASEGEASTIKSWLTPSPDGEVRAYNVRQTARTNELGVVLIYEALLNTLESAINTIKRVVTETPAFNVFTGFDTYYIREDKDAYFKRQLCNINYYDAEQNILLNSVFPINQNISNPYEDTLIRGVFSNLPMNPLSSYFHFAMLKKDPLGNGLIAALNQMVVRLPYALIINPLNIITKPTNDVEYFTKALPDVNLFYILQDQYIDLTTAVSPAYKSELETYIQDLHNPKNSFRFNIKIDYITHQYCLFNFYNRYDSSFLMDNKIVSFFAESATHSIRRAIDSSKLSEFSLRIMPANYVENIRDLVQSSNECSMCGGQRSVLDTTLIPDGVAFKYTDEDLLPHMFKKPSKTEPYQTVYNNHLICSRCLGDYRHQMDLYNGFFNRDNCFIGPDSVASAERISVNYKINDYSYRPDDLNFVRTTDDHINELHLGVELEMDDPDYREDGYYDDEDDEYVDESSGSAEITTNQGASMFINTLTKGVDFAYAMSDGSLHHGFEIATMPATLKAHLDPQFFDYKKAFSKIVTAGYRSHDTRTCGIHVHMDRSFFGSNRTQQMYRAALMAYILERNWQDVSRFSRRRIHNLEQWAKKKDLASFLDKFDSMERTGDKFLIEYDHDKYVMFNTMHRNSFELRIFRGTLNPTTYFATLQFVDNLARLVLNIDVAKAQQITLKDIINYNPHPELVAYVTSRFGENYLGE